MKCIVTTQGRCAGADRFGTSGDKTSTNRSVEIVQIGTLHAITLVLFGIRGASKGSDAMDANVDDKWMTRQEVADRHGVPVKTLAQWAS